MPRILVADAPSGALLAAAVNVAAIHKVLPSQASSVALTRELRDALSGDGEMPPAATAAGPR